MSLSGTLSRPASNASTASAAKAAVRLLSIDALRGFVMICMLVDHVRETFFLHRQVSDPMDALSTPLDLFFTRMVSQICAPAFIFLTGLSAWLYSQKHSKQETSVFLLKRGLFMVLLEISVVCFAWSFEFPFTTLWLQVIWCIGICMIALALLIHINPRLLLIIALAIVAGHNLLDGIVLSAESPFYEVWAVLHQRAFIELGEVTRARTTYPVLPWIGVIALGYLLGRSLYAGNGTQQRTAALVRMGLMILTGFVLIRALNIYGDAPWTAGASAAETFKSFFAARKYPPSLMFLMPTLGISLLLLALFERVQQNGIIKNLAQFGGAPMFFYILHLYVLKILYIAAVALFGLNQGKYFGFENLSSVWVMWALLALALWWPTIWFARYKQRRRDIRWLKYL